MTDSAFKQHIQACLRAGRHEEAVRLCQEALRSDPDNVYCLSLLAQQAFIANRLDEAEGWLLKVLALRPAAPGIRQNLGLLYQRRGQPVAATRQFFLGLQAMPEGSASAEMALILASQLMHLNPPLAARLVAWLFSQQPNLARAWHMPEAPRTIQQLSTLSNKFLARQRFQSQWQAVREALGNQAPGTERVRLFLEYFHGLKPIQWAHPLQRPSYHFFPSLRAQPFYDLDAPWLETLRAGFEVIRDEKNALLNARSAIKPYVDEQTPDDPDWKKLEKNLTWSSAHLLKGGVVNEEVAAQCPQTMQVLEQLPLVRLAEHAPEAFFSILRPGTYIPPHFGLSNLKLTVHLGLDIPANCAIKVGEEQRGWQPGEVLVFDDSFRHEAWNRSGQDRAVLITEIWHPDIRPEEQQALAAIMQEQAGYNQQLAAEEWPQLVTAIEQALAEADAGRD